MHAIHISALLGAALTAGRFLLVALCFAANSFYVFAILAAGRFFSARREPNPEFHPPISILKPVCGLDRDAYENFASFCRQDYPCYEVIFGAADEADPGLQVARQIAHDFPGVPIRIVGNCRPAGANPKVSNLVSMEAFARYPLLLVSDSDIRCGPDHLRALVAPLREPATAVVTCLYRSQAGGFAGWLDALGLSAEFQPGVLVANALEGTRFAMGSGILIRRSVLDEIGGFRAIADYLADDFLLGNLPARAGHRVVLSSEVVEHRLDTRSLAELARHQIRWNRGIRVCRPWGYAGLVWTQGVAAGLLLLLLTHGSRPAWLLLAATVALRLFEVWTIAVRRLRDQAARRFLWMVPVRDVISFGLWIAGFFGNRIAWRGERFRLGRGGRLEPWTPTALPGAQGAPTATGAGGPL
jgi:ceramide glucosyltransferase